jgi:hypothetical protein
MPLGRIFTQEDPYFLNGQDLARGYENYVNKHQIVSISSLTSQIAVIA